MSLGPIETNAHIIYQDGKALIIDAPLNSFNTINGFLVEQKLEPQALLLTHGHWDHIGDAQILREVLQVKVWASQQDRLLFENPEIMRSFAGQNIPLRPVTIDCLLNVDFFQKNTQSAICSVNWGDSVLELIVYAMPGHSPGGIAFYFPPAGCVMAGDQLFYGSVGNSDLPGGNFELLSASIRKLLYCLPPETIVFPGHGEHTTIHHEMDNNPFVRCSK